MDILVPFIRTIGPPGPPGILVGKNCAQNRSLIVSTAIHRIFIKYLHNHTLYK